MVTGNKRYKRQVTSMTAVIHGWIYFLMKGKGCGEKFIFIKVLALFQLQLFKSAYKRVSFQLVLSHYFLNIIRTKNYLSYDD
jgi:hypothetical protein